MHHLYCITVAIVALLTEHVYHPTDHIKNAINLHNKHSNHKNEEHNLNKIEGARQELDCATEASDEQINQGHPAMNNHSGLIYFQLGHTKVRDRISNSPGQQITSTRQARARMRRKRGARCGPPILIAIPIKWPHMARSPVGATAEEQTH